MFAGKKSAQIREILISESTREEMTCLFAPSPVLLFTGGGGVYICFFMILLFPLINTLERCSESRFKFDYFKDLFLTNRKNGRYVYYLILLIAGLTCCYIFGEYTFYVFSCYAFYYMAFRLLSAQVNLNE